MEVMKQMPNGSVDLVVTDIPYGKVNRKSNGLWNIDKGKADIITFELSDFIKECCRIVRGGGSLYIFCGTEQVSEIRKILVEQKLSTRLIIWEKSNPSPMNGQNIWLSGVECCVYGKFSKATYNGYCENTVLKYPCGRNKVHPTQKPEKLIEKLITQSSNEGDTVFDPCMGSGTTGIVSIKNNRNFVGIELDENYFNVAKERINGVLDGVSK